MKFGYRTPSIKRSISARTTGKIKRTVKKTINPTYGKKGTGLINDPKKSIYNKIYNKTTTSINDTHKKSSKKSVKSSKDYSYNYDEFNKKKSADISSKIRVGILHLWYLIAFYGYKEETKKIIDKTT